MLYLGQEPVPHAARALRQAEQDGLCPAYVTNNASRAPSAVAAHLVELGIPATGQDVVTSAQAAARLLARRLPPGAQVLVVGTDSLAQEVADVGLRPVREADGPRGAAQAVVQGLAPDTAWTDLAEAAVAIRRGALWVAGNGDSTYPSPRGPLPGNGALVAALALATGRQPEVAGKPEPTLHRESVERVGAQRPLVIGDRLDSDVLGAVRAGIDSLLVLTGVDDRVALLAAPAGCRPSYVASDLRGLLVAHVQPRLEDGRATCGQAVASLDADRVVVDGNGDDALRAECALTWSLADSGQQGKGG